jgi:hypothetical protein
MIQERGRFLRGFEDGRHRFQEFGGEERLREEP